MADTEIVLEAVARALRQADRLSAIEGVHTRELDLQGTDASAAFPLIELQPISEPQPDGGMSFVRYVRDANGNEVGEIYEWLIELRIQIDIWTMSGSSHDAISLGSELKDTLFRYDQRGYDDLLPDGNNGGIAEINLQIGDGSTANTRGLSGGSMFLRRWRQDVITTFVKRVNTHEEYGDLPYINDVRYPADGDYHSPTDERVEAQYPYSE